jgi:hypothetical protein
MSNMSKGSGRIEFTIPWGKLGAPNLEGTVIMPQQQSMCHKAEFHDLADVQCSEILEVHQAIGHIPISRLQQAVTNMTRGQLHHSSRSVHRLLSNTAFDVSTAVIFKLL